MASFKEVEQAVAAWSLQGVVVATDIKSRRKVRVRIGDEEQVYPYWLAVRKVNQYGAEQGV